MLFGQISYKGLSNISDYVQLDICGLNKEEVLNKYLTYFKGKDVILHGDWYKKVNGLRCSENNILTFRKDEYIEIINELKKFTNILGITLHPIHRNKGDIKIFTNIKNEIQRICEIDVFVENRSSKSIYLSDPLEIVNYSQNNFMTIDIPQLFISCDFSNEKMYEILRMLNKDNIKEIHIANIMRDNNRTFVARKLNDGMINLQNVVKIFDNQYYTLEIFGGLKTFETESELLKEWRMNEIIK